MAAGLNCRHELLYAKSWGFEFSAAGSGPGPWLGRALHAGIGGMQDREVLRLIARFHGLEVDQNAPGKEGLAKLASEAVASGTPLILKRTELREGRSPFLLLTDLDDRSFCYLNYEIDRASGTSEEVCRAELVHLHEWTGAAYTFNAVASEKLTAVACHDIVAAGLIAGAGSESPFEQMRRFADELTAMPDLAAETSGYSIQFTVPLFYQLMRISQGRYQFAELLTFVGEGLIIQDFSEIARDLRRIGQGWNLVRSLLIKASLTHRPTTILPRLGAKVVELASSERGLSERLAQVCASRETGVATFLPTQSQ